MNLLNLLSLLTLFSACGKSGPPLPPLVRVPVPPANVTADRRGEVVDLQFTVPDMNTDRTRPANIERVDVYAVTGSQTLTDEQFLKRGTKVASVPVKSPKNPDETVREDEPAEDVEAPSGNGLDQGALARLSETLTPAARAPLELTRQERRHQAQAADKGRPLIGPPPEPLARVYAVVGVSTRGKPGPLSRRVSAPLVEAPPAPGQPALTYTETEVTVTWPAEAAGAGGDVDVLPSHPIGASASTFGYNVYDVSTEVPQKITKAPVAETTVVDPRIAWGEKRCYAVRAATTVGGVTIESEPSPTSCETLTDTFPPAPPKALRSVAGEGSISLIWDASTESDLAGYVILRAMGGGPMQQITPEPIQETTFTDMVQSGLRFSYEVKAVDKAGNASASSDRVEETAR